jgi:hypothetical protein
METLLSKQNVANKRSSVLPFITISLQLEVAHHTTISFELKSRNLIDKVKDSLSSISGIPDYMIMPAIRKLENILNNLIHNVADRSVIIFLSPFSEKVYYLNGLIEEKIAVGEPLNLRRIILNKIEKKRYLVLSLHKTESFIYQGEGEKLSNIVFNCAGHIKSYGNTERERFLSHVDNVLNTILRTYILPFIVVGNQNDLSQFKAISRNGKEMISTIYADDYIETPEVIKQLIKPVTDEWNKLKESYLMMKLEKDITNKKAETGIDNVYKAVKAKRGTLLIVEKDFYYPLKFTNADACMYENAESSDGLLITIDAVEECIEKVLSNGGNVEFVTNNRLKEDKHIALIL